MKSVINSFNIEFYIYETELIGELSSSDLQSIKEKIDENQKLSNIKISDQGPFIHISLDAYYNSGSSIDSVQTMAESQVHLSISKYLKKN